MLAVKCGKKPGRIGCVFFPSCGFAVCISAIKQRVEIIVTNMKTTVTDKLFIRSSSNKTWPQLNGQEQTISNIGCFLCSLLCARVRVFFFIIYLPVRTVMRTVVADRVRHRIDIFSSIFMVMVCIMRHLFESDGASVAIQNMRNASASLCSCFFTRCRISAVLCHSLEETNAIFI